MFRKLLFSLSVSLVAVLSVVSGCSSDQEVVRPSAFVSPVDGKQYCAWVNTPHECDGSGFPAAPFALPVSQPSYSDRNYDLLEDLFIYHLTYPVFFGGPSYYDYYIRPAWQRYPSQSGYTQVTKNYYYSNAKTFDTKFSTQEESLTKKATYTSSSGKKYTGNTVPTKSFSGSNSKISSGGGAKLVSPGSKSVSKGGSFSGGSRSRGR